MTNTQTHTSDSFDAATALVRFFLPGSFGSPELDSLVLADIKAERAWTNTTDATAYDTTQIELTVPDHQADNPCYKPALAFEHGYDDGRWFSGRRRPGAVRGRDRNYDLGFALGMLDAVEVDQDKVLCDRLMVCTCDDA